MNLGAIRVMGLRTSQVVAYSAMILGYLGVNGDIWLLLGIGVVYGVVDYLVIFKQEQSFSVRMNPELNRLFKEKR
jgi:hypothetical protein